MVEVTHALPAGLLDLGAEGRPMREACHLRDERLAGVAREFFARDIRQRQEERVLKRKRVQFFWRIELRPSWSQSSALKTAISLAAECVRRARRKICVSSA